MIPYATSRRRSSRRSRPWRKLARVCLEMLECRTTPSLTPWPSLSNPVVETSANDTADRALDLGVLGATQPGEAVGTVGGTSGAADVDWLTFSLDRASRVVLTTLNELAGTSLVSVLTLYNQDSESWSDPQNPSGNRLLAQADAADDEQQDVRVIRNLPAGTYYVAMSGSGNRDFHPYLADSGQFGSTGDYGLLITVTDLGLDPADGPSVVSTDPEADAVRSRSPFVVRVTLNEGLDLSTLPADPSVDDWVQLRYDASGDFSDGGDGVVALSTVNYSSAVNELQLTPLAPLRAGFYQVFLAGDALTWPTVLRDLDGNPLGFNSNNPDGVDFTASFQINGSEGTEGATPMADDTQDTAHALGELVVDQFALRRGAIGDDPAYDPTIPDPFLIDPAATDLPPYLFNPAADVDVYSFQVAGDGSYLLIAEVWAGRIGSPLDPALSLYRNEGPGQEPTPLATNDSTLNPTRGTNGSTPIFADSTLLWNLPAGDYFVVVSSTGNMPELGAEGVSNPLVSHSGRTAYSQPGNYVLNLGVHQDTARPEVVSVTPADGAEVSGPPTRLVVGFNEYVNVHELGIRAQGETGESTISSVWVESEDGTRYSPRYESYDSATDEAVFLMLDSLVSGTYTLHLSGSEGLTDLAGNPLAGNDPADPAADYRVSFTVTNPAPTRDAFGRLAFTTLDPNDSDPQAQDLGIFFPHDIQIGVIVQRDFTADPASAPADSVDYYRFELLQNQNYLFQFNNHNLPPGTQPQLKDSAGITVPLSRMGSEVGGGAHLMPGIYTLNIGGWTFANAATVTYDFHIRLQGNQSSEAPVATGALAASRFRLVTTPPAPPTTQEAPPPSSSEAPPPETPPSPEAPPLVIQETPPLPLASVLPPPPPQAPAPASEPPASLPSEAPPSIPVGAPPVEPSAPPSPSNPVANSFLPQGPASQPLGPGSPSRGIETPALPPQASLLLVTIVTPTVPDSVAPPTARVALTTTVSRLPEGAAFPGLLTSLRAGPMGGVQDAGPRDNTSQIANQNSLNLEPLLTRDPGRRTVQTGPEPGGTLLTANDTQASNLGIPGQTPNPSVSGSWRQVLEMIFGNPPAHDGTPLSMPTGPQMRRLWNATIDALFTPPGNGEEGQADESEFDGAEMASILPESVVEREGSMVGPTLAAAGGAIALFNLHRREDEKDRS